MTIQKLASIVCKHEGKKSQVKIGDVREILRILVDIECSINEIGIGGPSWIIFKLAKERMLKEEKKLLKRKQK